MHEEKKNKAKGQSFKEGKPGKRNKNKCGRSSVECRERDIEEGVAKQ